MKEYYKIFKQFMKTFYIKGASLIFLSIFSSCHQEETVAIDEKPKAQVKVVSPQKEDLKVQQNFFGTSVYLSRNLITSPIPAFITKVHIRLGQSVNKGDLLYELETKEHRALQGQQLSDSIPENFGYINVKAPADGIISTLDKQQPGDYVLEGMLLCTVAESKQLVFQLNLPYEYNNIVKKNPDCEVQLPDSTVLDARIVSPLTTMNLLTQTQPFLIKPVKSVFIPENMIVSIRLTVDEKKKTQTLSSSCVLSDALMKEFWVMKMVNDSTAIKAGVTIGIKQQDKIEILDPVFLSSDKILSEGNYGLSDTTLVKIIK
jgi:hypothetical protein